MFDMIESPTIDVMIVTSSIYTTLQWSFSSRLKGTRQGKTDMGTGGGRTSIVASALRGFSLHFPQKGDFCCPEFDMKNYASKLEPKHAEAIQRLNENMKYFNPNSRYKRPIT